MTDKEIIRCQKSDQSSDCQTCPDHARCAELGRAEYLRQFGPEPPEDLPTTTHEWVRAKGGAEYEV